MKTVIAGKWEGGGGTIDPVPGVGLIFTQLVCKIAYSQ